MRKFARKRQAGQHEGKVDSKGDLAYCSIGHGQKYAAFLGGEKRENIAHSQAYGGRAHNTLCQLCKHVRE